MVITKDTELYSLVQSDKVISLIKDVKLKIHSYIYNRNFTLKLEMANGHLNEKYIVYSKPVYNTMANNVLKGYERVETDAEDLVKEISKAAILKQISELDELITCLNRELEKIRDAISSLQSEYLDNMDKVKNAVIPEEGSTSVYLDRSALSQYGGGAFLQSTYYLSSESDRSSVSNRIHRAYYQTYDPRGIIDLQENFRDKYKAKLDAANKKKQELESQLEKTYYDPTKIYDKDGNVIGSINDQKTTEPIMTQQFKDGEEKYIEGQKYTVAGYIVTDSGENRVIYKKGNDLYYLDSNGIPQKAFNFKIVGDPKWTVDGKEYDSSSPNIHMNDTTAFIVSEIDQNYTYSPEINGNECVVGNTLYYNGHAYKKLVNQSGLDKIMGNTDNMYVSTITTETGEHELYGNPFTPYYIEDNGVVYQAKVHTFEGNINDGGINSVHTVYTPMVDYENATNVKQTQIDKYNKETHI